MDNREMIRETEFTDETGKGFILQYFLSNQTTGEQKERNDEGDVFCIAVEKRQKNAKRIVCAAEDTGWFIADRPLALSLIDLFSAHIVTPISLPYVFDDVFSRT